MNEIAALEQELQKYKAPKEPETIRKPLPCKGCKNKVPCVKADDEVPPCAVQLLDEITALEQKVHEYATDNEDLCDKIKDLEAELKKKDKILTNVLLIYASHGCQGQHNAQCITCLEYRQIQEALKPKEASK